MPRPFARPAWLAGFLLVVGASSASALNFHTTTTTSISGNCLTQSTSQNTGGTFINTSQAGSALTGPINAACAASYQPGPWEARATSSASLSGRQLEVLASGENSTATVTLFPLGSPLNLQVRAVASFSDTFRLVPPTGYSGPNPIIDIVLTMTATTTMGAGPAGSNAAHLNWFLQTSTATLANLRTTRCLESGAISNPQPCFFLGVNDTSRSCIA